MSNLKKKSVLASFILKFLSVLFVYQISNGVLASNHNIDLENIGMFNAIPSDFNENFKSSVKKLNSDDYKIEKEGLSKLIELGEAGNTAALSRLVMMYVSNVYFSKEFLAQEKIEFPDFKNTLYWTEKWAEHNNIPSMVILADSYRTGLNSISSEKKAEYWYNQAYDQITTRIDAIKLSKHKEIGLIFLSYLEYCGLGTEVKTASAKKHLKEAGKQRCGNFETISRETL